MSRFKLKPKPSLKPNEKHLFTKVLPNQNYETGGFMDFEKKKGLERTVITVGTAKQVTPYSVDWETGWHTHASQEKFPSKYDLMAVAKTKTQQGEYIFTNDGITTIRKNKKFKQYKGMDKDIESWSKKYPKESNDFKQANKDLKKTGLEVDYYKVWV
jgi:hypothetical protein